MIPDINFEKFFSDLHHSPEYSEVTTGSWTLVLAGFVLAIRAKVVVEIGCHKGATTAVLAECCRRVGGKLYSYDNNPGYVSFVSDRISRMGLDASVICADSSLVQPEHKIDLLYMDGDHSYEMIMKDWLNWSQHINIGGFIFIHDANEKQVYKTIDVFRCDENWNCMTIPHEHGMAIFQKL